VTFNIITHYILYNTLMLMVDQVECRKYIKL